jgi:hypothetical protein
MVIDLLERDGLISTPNRRSRRWKDMHELLKRSPVLREKNSRVRRTAQSPRPGPSGPRPRFDKGS